MIAEQMLPAQLAQPRQPLTLPTSRSERLMSVESIAAL